MTRRLKELQNQKDSQRSCVCVLFCFLNRLHSLEKSEVPSKTEWKVQRLPIYPPPHTGIPSPLSTSPTRVAHLLQKINKHCHMSVAPIWKAQARALESPTQGHMARCCQRKDQNAWVPILYPFLINHNALGEAYMAKYRSPDIHSTGCLISLDL